MSAWLFNVYMAGVVRAVHAKMLSRGFSLANTDGREWNLSQLLSCLNMSAAGMCDVTLVV